MGGGDLNLKKRWHPSTRANLEKVYLAEIDAQKEQKKIEELQKEKRRERELLEIRKIKEAAGIIQKHTDRIDWMYSTSFSNQSAPDKKISSKDKPKEKEICAEKASVVGKKRWDIEAKIREDPLTKIIKSRKAHER